MYKCLYFKIHELVPPETYDQYGEFAWSFLDPQALMLIDYIRGRYGPMTCNNYMYKGDRTESGLRLTSSKHYSPYSQHTFGRAFDLIPKNVTAKEIRDDFAKGEFDSFLTNNGIQATLENDVSWLHVDVRNNNNTVNFFNP